ncbi:hypothetical protein [Desulfuromonas sp. TF]|uniref:hypothetical protein n=1 Tax=Desulfuromonas sp. TF TaxID=1232410 RepID=UPI0012DF77CC|nr:hypothetical protein [Desulfuromonas sp. TF]
MTVSSLADGSFHQSEAASWSLATESSATNSTPISAPNANIPKNIQIKTTSFSFQDVQDRYPFKNPMISVSFSLTTTMVFATLRAD